MFWGAVADMDASQRKWSERKRLVKPPTYPDRCVPLKSAVAVFKTFLSGYFKEMKTCAENRAFNVSCAGSLKAEREALLSEGRERYGEGYDLQLPFRLS